MQSLLTTQGLSQNSPNHYYAFLRIFTHFKKIVKIREFLRILKPSVTNSRTLVARLHNSCIHSVVSHSRSQITPLTHSSMHYVIWNCPPPQKKKIQMWPPRWPPQTAAARNASGLSVSLTVEDKRRVQLVLNSPLINITSRVDRT